MYYRSKKTILINNLENNQLYKPNERSSKKYYSLICVPIMSGEHVWGVLSIDGEKKESFTEE